MHNTGYTVEGLLLTERRLLFPPAPTSATLDEQLIRGFALELASIGYSLSTRLERRLRKVSEQDLASLLERTKEALLTLVGGNLNHVPLFRNFPQDVPADTKQLWWDKVLVHYRQAPDQACIFCGHTSTTHVLNPCQHVVCDTCFDGSNYSACPVCEHHVDRTSPFFRPGPVWPRTSTDEHVRFKRLDLGDSLESAVEKEFVSFCQRTQALSPADRIFLLAILREFSTHVVDWLPKTIPVRENIASVFGTLIQSLGASVFPLARTYITTPTDVLRLIEVMSGRDGALQPEKKYHVVPINAPPDRFRDALKKRLKTRTPSDARAQVPVAVQHHRFQVAKLPRATRRWLLELLERFETDRLAEDMLRHRSYWIWVGEFLHPAEYAKRFPKAAAAFQIVRGKASDGTPAPKFRTWNSRLEQAITSRSVEEITAMLRGRPGEFARKVDLALRLAGDNQTDRAKVLSAIAPLVPKFTTPVLMTLLRHLPARLCRAPVRVYWPKGKVATGAVEPDNRPLLRHDAVEPMVEIIERELTTRFASKPSCSLAVVDEELRNVIVPFNERTSSQEAALLPRGSRVSIPVEKVLRTFLHWCQPETNGRTTDLDLSVAFYDEKWNYIDVCSYYQLQAKTRSGKVIARSAGDLRDAPWPDGATEFVDLHSEEALAAGIRFAVMVVNNYMGMPFDQLGRAFAGLMIRNSAEGPHFDPRTVTLKFTVSGANGVFLPLAIDLQEQRLHWIDVQDAGRLAMNNVASSKMAIGKLCPALIAYFESDTRPSMYDLAILHAASRANTVAIRSLDSRDGGFEVFNRRTGEDAMSLLGRMKRGQSDARLEELSGDGSPAMAFLHRGDVALPDGSNIYALFPERCRSTTSASDWLT